MELEEFGTWQVVDLAGASEYPDWCEAALWFFLERMRLVMDDESLRGQLKIVVVDEAWRYLKDPAGRPQAGRGRQDVAEDERRPHPRHAVGPATFWAPPPSFSNRCRRGSCWANSSFPDEAARVLGLAPSELATVKELEPKRELYIHRPGHSAVVRLEVDPESYWLYTSDPADAVRRRAAVERWGLPGALMRLAAGVDRDVGEAAGRSEVAR